jgi:FtsP/CotA-like multicopper oxidase with cupredoxin domain
MGAMRMGEGQGSETGEKTMGSMQMSGGADVADVKYDAFLLNGKPNADPWTCKARAGERIRFRLINGGASTFFRFMIDGHSLLITHADGEAVQPVEVDSLLLGMAECYDAIVTVAASGTYTIRAEAQDGSGAALGVLYTSDVKPAVSQEPAHWGPHQLQYHELQAVAPTTLPDGPIHKIRLTLGGNMSQYVWSINDQYYPQAEPLLIREGERVQVEMVNTTAMFHPMHLHGHFFRLLTRTRDDPLAPLKHTVSVAPRETVRFEFAANNPGKWFFHCHNLYHLKTGMAREWHYKV